MTPEFHMGPAEDFMIKELKKNCHKIHIISDLIDLALLLRKSGGFIGNDSGVTHLAAFIGLPTVAIFGPSDYAIFSA